MPEAHNTANADRESRALFAVHTGRFWPGAIPFHHLWPAVPGKDESSPVAYRGRRAALIALFENRVTWTAIRDWSHGRRTMPQWARDILKSELKRQIAERQHVLDILDGR